MGTNEKRKTMLQKNREMVYAKYDGHCAYCGCKLELEETEVSYIKAYRMYSHDCRDQVLFRLNDFDNLMPSCKMCNFYKGDRDVEYLRNYLQGKTVERMQRPSEYKLALKYGLIEEHIHPIRFFYETEENIYFS